MLKDYVAHLSPEKTPQTEPLHGKSMVKNSAGGFTFALSDWQRLERFLLLGCAGGTYYASERKLTLENAECVKRCLAQDGMRAVSLVVQTLKQGRSLKPDAGLLALALAASFRPCEKDSYQGQAVRRYALDSLPEACKTPTQLFAFISACQQLRGWGRGLRQGVQNWYLKKEPRDLAYQVSKYASREGFTHKDLMRLCHLRSQGDHQIIQHYCEHGWPEVGESPHDNRNLLPIWAAERAKKATSKKEILHLIQEYRLVRECIPTVWLQNPEVWESLLEEMPIGALLRNLATLTRIGVLTPLAEATRKVCARLGNQELLVRGRVHPLAILQASSIYARGRGEKGQHTWKPSQEIVSALDGAFRLAFASVEPTNKRWYYGLDVSGSMASGTIAGMATLTPREVSAALALVLAATEPRHYLAGFCERMRELPISPGHSLAEVARKISNLPFGRTDCSLPMRDALEKKLPVDVFVIWTDNETYAGNMHPVEALRQYRQKMGISARLAVCAMTSTGFTIADPEDAGMLDLVGVDPAVPAVLSLFANQE